MEPIQIEDKKIIDAYNIKPTLPFDIDGILIEKKGKDIKVKNTVNNKTVIYSIRLKEEIDGKVGETVHIEKENITSSSIRVEDELKVRVEDEDYKFRLENMLLKLGIEVNKETLEIAELLSQNNIPINKKNIYSYLLGKKYLKDIMRNINYDSLTKLMDRGISIEDESLNKLWQAFNEIEDEENNSSRLTYDDAEKIANRIFKSRMGKDVYDAIIALHKRGMDITKENIERITNVINKVNELKYLEYEDFVELKSLDIKANIDNLYRIKNSIDISGIDKNDFSKAYELFMVERSLDKFDLQLFEGEIANILLNIGIEPNDENLSIGKEFVKYDVKIDEDNWKELHRMKKDLKNVREKIDEGKVANLLKKGLNPLKEDISKLSKILEEDDEYGALPSLDRKEVLSILDEIKSVGEIDDEALVLLLKSGNDFKISDIKNINYILSLETKQYISSVEPKLWNTLDKAITISHMFATIENLDSNTIAFAAKKGFLVSLNSLYESEAYLQQNPVKVNAIDAKEESFIRDEYLRFKENLSSRILRESIEEGLNIENIPLSEGNEYIDKKVDKYRKQREFVSYIKKLNPDDVIPIIIKDDLNMSLGEIERVSKFIDNESGLWNSFQKAMNNLNGIENSQVKEEMIKIEKKSKKLSESLKKDEDAKEMYKDILMDFSDLEDHMDDDQNMKDMKDSLYLEKAMSKKDIVIQLPILKENGYENLQLFIKDGMEKPLDKKNMTFYLNLSTEKLGNLKFDIEIYKNNIYVKINSQSEYSIETLKKWEDILNRRFKSIGYELKDFSYVEDNVESKDEAK